MCAQFSRDKFSPNVSTQSIIPEESQILEMAQCCGPEKFDQTPPNIAIWNPSPTSPMYCGPTCYDDPLTTLGERLFGDEQCGDSNCRILITHLPPGQQMGGIERFTIGSTKRRKPQISLPHAICQGLVRKLKNTFIVRCPSRLARSMKRVPSR